MMFYAPYKNIEGFPWKTSKADKAQKLKFYSTHRYKLKNQLSCPVFDCLTQNFEIGFII
jgi:hypothetical protein